MLDPLKQIRKSHVFPKRIYFWTATIHRWLNLLEEDFFKDIILNDLKYYSEKGALKIYAFVIMPNHIHLIFSEEKQLSKEQPHVSLLKHTAHLFQKKLRTENPIFYNEFKVDAKNKKYQFWQRDSLAVEMTSSKILEQKLTYIHNNPLQDHWNLVKHPCDYYYSSAKFWERDDLSFAFLSRF